MNLTPGVNYVYGLDGPSSPQNPRACRLLRGKGFPLLEAVGFAAFVLLALGLGRPKLDDFGQEQSF